MKISNKVLDDIIKDVNNIFEYYNYTVNRVPRAMLESNKFKEIIISIIIEIIEDNVLEVTNNFSNYEIDLDGYSTTLQNGDVYYSEYEINQIIGALIALDLKRKKKYKLLPELTEIPSKYMNDYIFGIYECMKSENLIKANYKFEKFKIKWPKLIKKIDNLIISHLGKENAKFKSGLFGLAEKTIQKNKIKNEVTLSPLNSMLINYSINQFVFMYSEQVALTLKEIIDSN